MKKIYLLLLIFISVVSSVLFSFLILSTYSQEPVAVEKNKIIFFRIDNRFSLEERNIIKKSFQNWERASDKFIKFDWSYSSISKFEVVSWKEDAIPTIYKATNPLGWEKFVAEFITGSNNLLGAASPVSRDIFIVNNDIKKLEVILTHELGHILLGSFHSSNPNSIMFPKLFDDNVKNMKIGKEEILLLKERWTY